MTESEGIDRPRRPVANYRQCPHCAEKGKYAFGRVERAPGRVRMFRCTECGKSFKRVFRIVRWYQYCPECKVKGRIGIGLVIKTNGRVRFLRCQRCGEPFKRIWDPAEPPEDERQN